MTDLWKPPPVLLYGHVPWELELVPYYASDLVLYLTSHDASQIRKYVLPSLNIHNAAESELDLLAEDVVGRDQIRNRRGMLKGMAMELLAASILQHLDKPRRVVAWVKEEDGQPTGVAPAGYADVTAEYPESKDTRAFKIFAEVSAKRNMNPKNYGDQLRSAYRHAQREIEKNPDLLVYCPLINCVRIFEDDARHKDYRDFLRENELTLESNIRIVPMYAPDFGVMIGTLASELKIEGMHFDPGVLAAALDAVYKAILRPSLPNESDWMIKLFVDTIRASLLAGLHDHDGGAPPGAQ